MGVAAFELLITYGCYPAAVRKDIILSIEL